MKKTLLISSTIAIGLITTASYVQASAPPKADKHMQKVLDALASLGGKPIETLSPEEARKQPTPADAVKKVLSESGKSTTPEAGVTVSDMNVPGPIGDIPVHVYTTAADLSSQIPRLMTRLRVP
jgi:acetyl esterase